MSPISESTPLTLQNCLRPKQEGFKPGNSCEYCKGITDTKKFCDSQFLFKQSDDLLAVVIPELSLLLEVSSSASCQHILIKCIRSCTYMNTLSLIQ